MPTGFSWILWKFLGWSERFVSANSELGTKRSLIIPGLATKRSLMIPGASTIGYFGPSQSSGFEAQCWNMRIWVKIIPLLFNLFQLVMVASGFGLSWCTYGSGVKVLTLSSTIIPFLQRVDNPHWAHWAICPRGLEGRDYSASNCTAVFCDFVRSYR